MSNAATTAHAKFYLAAMTLADIPVNQWREIAVRGSRPARLKEGGQEDYWAWHLDIRDQRKLTYELAPVGEIITAQHRSPDGFLRLLAMRVPVKLQGTFREDAHLRNKLGELRPRTFNRIGGSGRGSQT